jgi:hypothetical protein
VHAEQHPRRPVDFDRRDVDLAGRVDRLVPDTLSVSIERDREAGERGDLLGVRVQLDLDAVWGVLAGRIPEDMPARDQEQPIVALEEEPCGVWSAAADPRR